VGTQPWPLQPFWPPQPWPPPAHAPLPLQELIPAHFTSPPALSWPAALSAALAAVANIAHTAEAMKAAFTLFPFMFDTSSLRSDCGSSAASSTAHRLRSRGASRTSRGRGEKRQLQRTLFGHDRTGRQAKGHRASVRLRRDDAASQVCLAAGGPRPEGL